MMKNNLPPWLYRRPRVLNILHAAGFSVAYSQMNAEEKSCLEKYATGKNKALEIGTYMGVTATIIAGAMNKTGKLYCVDPFEAAGNNENPLFSITKRELKRNSVNQKIIFLRGFSNDRQIIAQIPVELDFILIDGDHSYKGLENDWQIVLSTLNSGGIVCLHDTSIPPAEPYRNFGSVDFFQDVIRRNSDFILLETAYSMNVLKKK